MRLSEATPAMAGYEYKCVNGVGSALAVKRGAIVVSEEVELGMVRGKQT